MKRWSGDSDGDASRMNTTHGTAQLSPLLLLIILLLRAAAYVSDSPSIAFSTCPTGSLHVGEELTFTAVANLANNMDLMRLCAHSSSHWHRATCFQVDRSNATLISMNLRVEQPGQHHLNLLCDDSGSGGGAYSSRYAMLEAVSSASTGCRAECTFTVAPKRGATMSFAEAHAYVNGHSFAPATATPATPAAATTASFSAFGKAKGAAQLALLQQQFGLGSRNSGNKRPKTAKLLELGCGTLAFLGAALAEESHLSYACVEPNSFLVSAALTLPARDEQQRLEYGEKDQSDEQQQQQQQQQQRFPLLERVLAQQARFTFADDFMFRTSSGAEEEDAEQFDLIFACKL